MSHNSIFYSLISISLSPSFPSHMIGSCCTHVHLYTTILQLYKSATITANYYLGLYTTTFSLLTIPIASNDVSKQKLNFLKWNGTHEPQGDALFSKPICHYSALQFNINNHRKRHSPTLTHTHINTANRTAVCHLRSRHSPERFHHHNHHHHRFPNRHFSPIWLSQLKTENAFSPVHCRAHVERQHLAGVHMEHVQHI